MSPEDTFVKLKRYCATGSPDFTVVSFSSESQARTLGGIGMFAPWAGTAGGERGMIGVGWRATADGCGGHGGTVRFGAVIGRRGAGGLTRFWVVVWAKAADSNRGNPAAMIAKNRQTLLIMTKIIQYRRRFTSKNYDFQLSENAAFTPA